ncbi:hypothetical protein E4U03_00985 [Rothia nasimurium]|uniref:Uncharacterized protein n=1 Tax=Rothia nasimurium TaxID=85336 RepID=A0A4Y9F6N7_9MICC|nr:hypothetical protein [Rothia nasimurium]MBF0807198.1 hypothetical protein [Rothia nasimurium]TFU24176.1 hypothetical protein E4U03_00985 [Rothia nasimurium]
MALAPTPARFAPAYALLATGILILTGCGSSQTATSTTSMPAETEVSVSSSAPPSPSASASPSPTAEPTTETASAAPSAVEIAVPSPSATALTPPVNDGFTIDPVSLVTTDLVTGTPVADLAAYNFAAADQPSVVFQTPDPQVACLMQTYGVFCMTDDSKNWVLQSVSMGPGDTQPRTVQARGRAATHDWFKTNTVLPEGQSISWMGMTCTTTGPVSVQCNDGTTGFNLSDLADR